MSAASEAYLSTLLLYYEEEVMGEAYFEGLCEHFPDAAERRKLRLLAEVEHHSAAAVRPLVDKYGLEPRVVEELHELGRRHVEPHASWSWKTFVTYMVERYPGYLDDFARLESLAPTEDLAPLEFLTRHEVAAIEFAKRELAGRADSVAPLEAYLAERPPALPANDG